MSLDICISSGLHVFTEVSAGGGGGGGGGLHTFRFPQVEHDLPRIDFQQGHKVTLRSEMTYEIHTSLGIFYYLQTFLNIQKQLSKQPQLHLTSTS